jgi:hypothetical protein
VDNDILFHWSFETIELIHNSMPIHLLIIHVISGAK